MIRLVLPFICVYIGVLQASDTNLSKMTIVSGTSSPTVYKYYKDANVSEKNISKFSMKDWEGQFSKQGLVNTSVIGNTTSLFGGSKSGKMAMTGDINNMKTSELLKNPDFKNNKSIGAMDSVLQSSIMANVAANVYGRPASKAKNIKCYVARDIGQTYVCTAPGNSLMVSSGMGGRDSLSKLKSDCEGQCFTQNSCINMQGSEAETHEPFPSKSFKLTASSPSVTFTIPTRSDLTVDTFDFNETIKGATVKYTVSYVDRNGISQKLIDNLISLSTRLEERSLYIGDIASSITVTIALSTPYPATISAQMEIGAITVNYHSNAQYVCPSVQDVSGYNPGDFANICKAGKLSTFSRTTGVLTKTFQICAAAIYPGQNQDGSFYQRNACESVCRRQYECKLLPGGSVNFESLKGFREGCIENTSLSCSNFNDDCKQARLNPSAKVINELVFGGDLRPTATIINGATTGVERPRLSISKLSPTLGANGGTYGPNDVEFETQRKEEWKDKAYTNMMTSGNWNVSKIAIGENTPANHAYGINLKTGSFYGYAGTSVRSLVWRLKPAAYDVGSGNTFKLYAILKAVVQNYRYEQSGTGLKKPFYDEVWYVKTSSADTYKPFYYNYDAYGILATTDDYNLSSIQYRPKTTAVGDFMSFDGLQWSTILPSSFAEYFQSENFSSTNAFWEYELLSNMEAKYDVLPGLTRWIEKTGDYNEILHYTGTREPMSASTIVKFSIGVGYATTDLSYKSLKDMMDAGVITQIYESGNENSYPRSFRGDGEKDNSSTMYMYGQAGNGSAYLDVRPRKDHIGKKGFIFVYGQ